MDNITKSIYLIKSFDEIEKIYNNLIADQYNIDDAKNIFNYIIHRCYNFNCSKICEDYFLKYGANNESNDKDKTIDFYLYNIPFDLKVTVFPQKLFNERYSYDLTSREGKNKLIQWMYANQSTEKRFHLENRLFIVCSKLDKKSDFEQIENKIKIFVDYFKQKPFNEIEIGREKLISDIIWVE
ncbi:MAG: hypothetical protein LBH55_01115 [Mycoplasmataceae bacterium]|jgi:hypothetical protein|nr:hypothetical protein [Mycoplasmataceae bacterium]